MPMEKECTGSSAPKVFVDSALCLCAMEVMRDESKPAGEEHRVGNVRHEALLHRVHDRLP